MQNEDKIKIFNDGKIERTKDNNIYDTVTNEDESKSIKIARTNVTENNPTGDSQIGELKNEKISIAGVGSDFGYFQVNDYNVATQIFEFIADNTKVEFGQDTFSFSDGFSTNIVGTNHSTNESASASDVLENNNLGGTSYHITKDAIRQERVHSHPPGSEWGPSGFDVSRNNKTGELTLQRTFLNPVGDRKAYSRNVGNTYQYTPGVGYFKYNKDTAKYTGKTKN